MPVNYEQEDSYNPYLRRPPGIPTIPGQPPQLPQVGSGTGSLTPTTPTTPPAPPQPVQTPPPLPGQGQTPFTPGPYGARAVTSEPATPPAAVNRPIVEQIPPQPSPPPAPGQGQGYMSDIAALRGMPQGLVDAYQRYIQQTQQAPLYQNYVQQELQRMGGPPQFADLFKQDINYLREVPGQGGYEQALLTTGDERVDQTYNAAKQRIIQNAARSGLDPSSGPVQEQMRLLEEQRAREKADNRRNLSMWQLGETRSRRGESRDVAQLLEQLSQQQGGRQIDLSKFLDESLLGRRGMEAGIFRDLDQYELWRRGQARGVEQGLDQSERQGLMDLYGFLQGSQPSSMPAQLTQQWAGQAADAASQAGAGFNDALGGLGQSGLYYWLLTNPGAANQFFGE